MSTVLNEYMIMMMTMIQAKLTSIDTVVRPSLTNLLCFCFTLTIFVYAELFAAVRSRSDDSMFARSF